jgi:hypothetical protein
MSDTSPARPPFETISTGGRFELPLARQPEPGEAAPHVFWGAITVKKRQQLRDAERRYREALNDARGDAEGRTESQVAAQLDTFRAALQQIHIAEGDEREQLVGSIPELLAADDLLSAPAADLLELDVIEAAERKTLETLAIVIDGVGGDLALHDRQLHGATWPADHAGRLALLERFSEVAIHRVWVAIDAAFRAGAAGLREDEAGN